MVNFLLPVPQFHPDFVLSGSTFTSSSCLSSFSSTSGLGTFSSLVTFVPLLHFVALVPFPPLVSFVPFPHLVTLVPLPHLVILVPLPHLVAQTWVRFLSVVLAVILLAIRSLLANATFPHTKVIIHVGLRNRLVCNRYQKVQTIPYLIFRSPRPSKRFF